MNYEKKFKKGDEVTVTEWQEVRQKVFINGIVKEVGEESIEIQFPDLKHPTEYDINEFDAIEHTMKTEEKYNTKVVKGKDLKVGDIVWNDETGQFEELTKQHGMKHITEVNGEFNFLVQIPTSSEKAEKKDNWVSVEKELPKVHENYKESDYVLVIIAGQMQHKLYRYKPLYGGWYAKGEDFPILLESDIITHWQPLPTLPTK